MLFRIFYLRAKFGNEMPKSPFAQWPSGPQHPHWFSELFKLFTFIKIGGFLLTGILKLLLLDHKQSFLGKELEKYIFLLCPCDWKVREKRKRVLGM